MPDVSSAARRCDQRRREQWRRDQSGALQYIGRRVAPTAVLAAPSVVAPLLPSVPAPAAPHAAQAQVTAAPPTNLQTTRHPTAVDPLVLVPTRNSSGRGDAPYTQPDRRDHSRPGPNPAHKNSSDTANGVSSAAPSGRHANDRSRAPLDRQVNDRDHNRDRDRDPEAPATDYKALYESLQAHKKLEQQRKRKRGNEKSVSTQCLGRGIRRVAVMFGEISAVITDAEEYALNPFPEDEPDDEGEKDVDEDGTDEGEPRQPPELTEEQEQYLFEKRECERNLESFNLIKRLIPNLEKRLKESDAEELIDFYGAIQKGANDARSDDVRRISICMANWLNDDCDRPELKIFDHTPPLEDDEGREVPQRAPLFRPGDRSNRGIQHDIAGGLLSQIEHDWIREELRSLSPGPDAAVINSSFYCRLFYADFDGDPDAVETGFLQSRYLVKGFKAKVKNLEKSNRKPVADILNMNGKVTGRSLAYIAILEHFSLTNATSWANQYYGISYPQMYNFIVDYFEAPRAGTAAKQRADKLLEWWNKQIFPDHAASAATQRTAVSSAAKLRAQRAAMEM
ncbi:hypothetical protein C8J57DRAFT_1718405 [Mycena rebaudengoi]|nr:hypothetical protein C8J57DRAFT_1718405 [Mycena rebaudengoi]